MTHSDRSATVKSSPVANFLFFSIASKKPKASASRAFFDSSKWAPKMMVGKKYSKVLWYIVDRSKWRYISTSARLAKSLGYKCSCSLLPYAETRYVRITRPRTTNIDRLMRWKVQQTAFTYSPIKLSQTRLSGEDINRQTRRRKLVPLSYLECRYCVGGIQL